MRKDFNYLCMSAWRNDGHCKSMFMSLLKNLAFKGLINVVQNPWCRMWCLGPNEWTHWPRVMHQWIRSSLVQIMACRLVSNLIRLNDHVTSSSFGAPFHAYNKIIEEVCQMIFTFLWIYGLIYIYFFRLTAHIWLILKNSSTGYMVIYKLIT